MGVGVHTGEKVFLTLKPAPENTGIVFHRIDLSPVITIPAKSDFVGDTRLSTTLIKDGVRISTVEHLLSALAGLGVDNAIVEITANEVPIMDGSSGPFVFLIQSAGIQEQSALKQFLRIKQTVKVTHGDAWALIKPYNGFKVKVQLDFDHPFLKKSNQVAELDFSSMSYVKEISRARTFGFMSDYEWLRANNLAIGASLDNTVVLDDYRVLNEDGLRSKDEFVKHKVLDVIGDLYLSGFSIIGSFSGFKTGHALNNALLKSLLSNKKAWEMVTFEEKDEPVPIAYFSRLGTQLA